MRTGSEALWPRAQRLNRVDVKKGELNSSHKLETEADYESQGNHEQSGRNNQL